MSQTSRTSVACCASWSASRIDHLGGLQGQRQGQGRHKRTGDAGGYIVHTWGTIGLDAPLTPLDWDVGVDALDLSGVGNLGAQPSDSEPSSDTDSDDDADEMEMDLLQNNDELKKYQDNNAQQTEPANNMLRNQ